MPENNVLNVFRLIIVNCLSETKPGWCVNNGVF